MHSSALLCLTIVLHYIIFPTFSLLSKLKNKNSNNSIMMSVLQSDTISYNQHLYVT